MDSDLKRLESLMERPSGVRKFEFLLSSYRKAGTGRDWIKLSLTIHLLCSIAGDFILELQYVIR